MIIFLQEYIWSAPIYLTFEGNSHRSQKLGRDRLGMGSRINDAFIFIYAIFHFPCDTYVRNHDIWSRGRRVCTLPRGILNAAGAPDCLFIQAARTTHIYSWRCIRPAFPLRSQPGPAIKTDGTEIIYEDAHLSAHIFNISRRCSTERKMHRNYITLRDISKANYWIAQMWKLWQLSTLLLQTDTLFTGDSKIRIYSIQLIRKMFILITQIYCNEK